MAERRLHQLPDIELEAVLRGLAPALAWPTPERFPGGPDIAATVRTRIESIPARREDRGPAVGRARWFGSSWRPARRALLLALVALLAVAAIAGAVGLGLPGLRLILGGVPPSGTPSSSPPTFEPGPSSSGGLLGGAMALGEALDALDAAALDARAGFPLRLPADPRLGPPGAAFIDDAKGGALTLLWAPSSDLSATLEPTVGLLLSEFRGSIDQGFFSKAIGNETTVERLRVGGNAGYWLSGDPHIFFWEGPNGFVDDPRRWVGDVLLWSDGPITYRLETALGRDEAVRIAESLP